MYGTLSNLHLLVSSHVLCIDEKIPVTESKHDVAMLLMSP